MKYMRSSLYEHALINNIITTEEGEYVSILEWIVQKINTSPDKNVMVDVAYMKKILGPEFRKKDENVVCSSLRHILMKYDVIVRRSFNNDGSMKITMRFPP